MNGEGKSQSEGVVERVSRGETGRETWLRRVSECKGLASVGTTTRRKALLSLRSLDTQPQGRITKNNTYGHVCRANPFVEGTS